MLTLKSFLLLTSLTFFWSCTESADQKAPEKSFHLSDSVKQELITKIAVIAELDQKYRNIISLGTMDKDLLQKDKELRKTATLQDYVAFTKTVEKTLTKEQTDSLWALQHKLDYQNYRDIKDIINTYGYPSAERLNVETDQLYAILLHPPIEIEPQEYLSEMKALLLPEVQKKRMETISFARFVDNIRTKVLQEPQLYGTVKSFNPATMSMGLPVIEGIEKTNKAREAIGLEPLKDGEYEAK